MSDLIKGHGRKEMYGDIGENRKMITAFLLCETCSARFNSIAAAGNHQTATQYAHKRFGVMWTE